MTLFVGPNNTGKTFVSRAVYAILKSCRGDECDVNRLTTLLLNTSIASEQDLWFVSREFCGKFSLMLEDKDLKFKVRIDYNKKQALSISELLRCSVVLGFKVLALEL